jgi:hypothetical protein
MWTFLATPFNQCPNKFVRLAGEAMLKSISTTLHKIFAMDMT